MAEPFDLASFLQQHAARRANGFPTVSVLVGPVGNSRRLWLRETDAAKIPILECLSEPLPLLRQHLLQRIVDLSHAVLRGLSQRNNRDPQEMIRDWPSKTHADAEAFWNALPPEPGDDLLRGILSKDVAHFPDERSLPRLLDCDLPSFAWPALFTVATTLQILTQWADLAQKQPKLSLTIAVPDDAWAEFVATTPDT